MRYSLIDRAKAPDPKGNVATRNAEVSDEIVASLGPGKVARIELSGKETVRGAKASLTRAGKRAGRTVRTWDVNGVVYAELIGAARAAAASES